MLAVSHYDVAEFTPYVINLIPIVICIMEFYMDTVSLELQNISSWPLSLGYPLLYLEAEVLARLIYFKNFDLDVVPLFTPKTTPFSTLA